MMSHDCSVPKGFLLLSIIYVACVISAQVLAYRIIQIGPFVEPGGIFLFPATFIIADILSEVYGPSLTRRVVFNTLVGQALFCLIAFIVLHMPHPPGWEHNTAYQYVLGSTWLVFLSNTVALSIGIIFSSQFIARTKLYTKGRYFIIRSFLASALGEIITTSIIVAIALLPVLGLSKAMNLFIGMYVAKAIYSIVMLIPANIAVIVCKKVDQIDAYESDIHLIYKVKRKKPYLKILSNVDKNP